MKNIESLKGWRGRAVVATGVAGIVLAALHDMHDAATYKISEHDRIEYCLSDKGDPYSLFKMRSGTDQGIQLKVELDDYGKLQKRVAAEVSDIYSRTWQNMGQINIDSLTPARNTFGLGTEASTKITKAGRLELRSSDLSDTTKDQIASISFKDGEPIIPVGAVVCDLGNLAVETQFVDMVDAFDESTKIYPSEQ